MGRYEEYKDSGVDWIGEIPAGWRVVPFRRFLSLYKGLAITKADLASEGVPVISYGQIHSKSNTGVATHQGLLRYVAGDCPALQSSSLTSVGDIVFADTSEDVEGCGSAFYIDRYGVYAGYHTLIAHPSDSSSGKYLAYLFQSPEWRSQIRKRVSGVKLFSVTRRILSDCTVLQPIKSEQVAAVAYLDAKTTEIDSLVEDCDREVELLQEYRKAVISEAVTKGLDPNAPMKDSGIDWIGEIPEGWQVAQLGRLCETRNGLDYDATQVCGASDEGSVLVIRSGNVSSGQLVLDDCLYIRKEVPDQLLLRKGDVVVVRTNGSKELVGKSALVKTDGVGTLGAFMLLCRSRFGRYINWLLQSTMLTYYMGAFSTSTVNQLSNGVLRRLHVPFPAEAVQEEICNYLDAKTAEIDSLIADYQSMADKLREYRTSLISEAVTGKLKVPGVA